MSTQSELTTSEAPVRCAPARHVVASAMSSKNDEHAQRHAKLLMRMTAEIGLQPNVKLVQVKIAPETNYGTGEYILIYQKKDSQQVNHCYMQISDSEKSLFYHVVFTNHTGMTGQEVYSTFSNRMEKNPWVPSEKL